jgi:hypothetical protein
MSGVYGLTLGAPFNAALNTGGSTSSLVSAGVFPVALNGRPYLLDLVSASGQSNFNHVSLPLLRTQADSSGTPGEQSVSPENFWRRAQDSWHLGAGQSYTDRDQANPFRFESSKGLNPWTKYQISLLNDVDEALSSANTNIRLAIAGGFLFTTDGNSTKYSSDGTSFTTVTGTPADPAKDIASDGRYVWVIYDDEVWQIDSTAGGTLAGARIASHASALRSISWNKNRVFVADESGKLYNMAATTDTALGSGTNTLIIDLSTRGFAWTAYAGGQAFHYFGGYRNDKSLIYRANLQTDATAISAPVVAGELPDGELINTMTYYLGYVILGTSLGVRLATTDNAGNLVIGGVIPTNAPVRALEAQDRFVWFGWTNYDSVSTGLGRMDLSQFIDPLVPAFASDLMVTGQGNVLSATYWNNKVVFSVSGEGVYIEDVNPVASGTLNTGKITHGISDPKVAVFIDLKHQALTAGDIKAEYSLDGEAFILAGISNIVGSVSPLSFQLSGARAQEFDIKITLTAGNNTSPILTRWLQRSYPAPTRSTRYRVPIMLYDIVNLDGTDYYLNPADEVAILVTLHKDQNVFTYQEGTKTYLVTMEDYTWLPEKESITDGFQGTFVAELREITG